MSLGKSQAEQELTSLLAKTLVQKEVLEPMNKLGWAPGQPPPPDYSTPGSGQPTPGGSTNAGSPPNPGQPGTVPAPSAKADTPPLDLSALYETLKNPETGLYADKYKTVEEAIKGSKHLAQMANKAFSERDEAAKKLASLTEENLRLRQTPTHAVAPVASPVQTVSRQSVEQAQANYEKVLSEIGEDGGVLDAEAGKKLARAGRELAAAEADYRVQEAFASRSTAQDAENRKWDEVESYMTQNHPDATKFSDEVALFVRSNTPLAKAVDALRKSGDLIAATELAWTTFKDVTGASVTAEKTAADQTREDTLAERERVRTEAREQALKDAGVISGSGGSGVHQGGNQRGTAEEREALRARMRIEGDAPGSPAAQRLREMIIPLPPGLFPN
jgi:hypothetical protein